MLIYFANMFGVKGLEDYIDTKIDVLAAYPALPKSGVLEIPSFINRFFLDSGAFTKQSEGIKIEEYMAYIKKHADKLEVYANLDVLFDARKTWKNQRIMEKSDLHPLPVYHRGSPVEWLEKIIDKYDYIAIGGVVAISTNKELVYKYLDYVWKVILERKPTLKVHGFGIHNEKIMSRYPWYSVDASSVHIMARYGGVFTPWGAFKINPNVNAKEAEWQIKKPLQKKKIIEFVEQTSEKFTYEEVSEQSKEGMLRRVAVSVKYFLSVVKDIQYKPKSHNNNLFGYEN